MAASQAPTDQSATKNRPTVLPENASDRNLEQRIADITGEVSVKATGRTQFGQAALSIGDVDEVLGALMSKHRVTSDYEYRSLPALMDDDHGNRVWLVDITGIMTNADDPKEEHQRRLSDIGSSPSAAVSFALKRWYRAKFKIVEDDDHQAQQSRGQASDFTSPRAAREAQPSNRPKLLDCPECGAKEVRRSKPRTDAEKANPDKLGWYCWKKEEKAFGCGANFVADDDRITRQLEGSTHERPPGPPPVTETQRKELGELHSKLPADRQLSVEQRRLLLAEGYEVAKETLTDWLQMAEPVAEDPNVDPLVDVDPDEASRAIDTQNTQASRENA